MPSRKRREHLLVSKGEKVFAKGRHSLCHITLDTRRGMTAGKKRGREIKLVRHEGNELEPETKGSALQLFLQKKGGNAPEGAATARVVWGGDPRVSREGGRSATESPRHRFARKEGSVRAQPTGRESLTIRKADERLGGRRLFGAGRTAQKAKTV